LALALAGCGTAETSAGSESWSIPDVDPVAEISVIGHQDPATSGLQVVLDAFAEDHPDITVNYEYVPFDQMNAILEARISSKEGNPDVYWADTPRIAALTARGYTEDITEQFSAYEDIWDSATYIGSSADGRLQGVPIANSTQLLYFNKDSLDSAGLEYPSADPAERITWEQVQVGAASAVDSGATNGLVFGQVDRYYQLQALPMSLGGSAGAVGDSNVTADVTSEAWVDSMEWYGETFESGISPRGVTPEENDAEFLAGKTAYFVQGPWLLPALEESDLNWGVALHPYFEAGEPVTATGSWALALNPFSLEKEAASIFMKWMSIDNGGGYTSNFPTPELPANVEGKAAYYERPVFASEEGVIAAEIIDFESSTTAISRLSSVGYVEFEEIIGRAFADIRNGSNAQEALEAASSELESAWSVYK
jgi:multiple sugar transport system substrate-binding protein